MAKVKAWKVGEAGSPAFPTDFKLVKNAVLQKTDIGSNNNKYYAVELHAGVPEGANYRVYTHYGRTDDLENNPESGQKECRYFGDPGSASSCYDQIFREKTGASKGYREVSLASTRIGSAKARGASVGEVDAKTTEKLAKAKAEQAEKEGKPKPAAPTLNLHPGIQDLVRYIFSEATTALTTTVAAKITANGIETPLGILTIGQIEKGELILAEMYKVFQKKGKSYENKLKDLSGDFYSAIPHRIGRTRDAVEAAIIASTEAFGQKQETLQLMKDMLQVNGEGDSNVLFDAQVDSQYLSLKSELAALDKDSKTYKEIADHVIKSQVKTKSIKVENVYGVKRPGEWDEFTSHIDNQRLMFHGSRIQNWVGILSRGILMPKIVVSMGVKRTDAGWLGNGIYFGDASCTSAYYTTPGKKKTRLMAVARVALGKMCEYTKITYGITEPPAGYHSCHGVRTNGKNGSQFADDEYVIYDPRQHRQEYLVELTV